MPFGELVEELVAAVGDRGREVVAVRQLEGQDGRGMASMQPLQLGHARLYQDAALTRLTRELSSSQDLSSSMLPVWGRRNRLTSTAMSARSQRSR